MSKPKLTLSQLVRRDMASVGVCRFNIVEGMALLGLLL